MNSFVLMWFLGAGGILAMWFIWTVAKLILDSKDRPIDRVALDRFERDMKLKKIRKARLERENGSDTGQ